MDCWETYTRLKSIQGCLKKLKRHKKTWTSDICLRYFVLDFSAGTLLYRKNQDSNKVLQCHTSCDILGFGPREDLGTGDWMYPFWILTKQREYQLLAATKAGQETWLYGLSTLQIPLPPLYYSSIPRVDTREIQSEAEMAVRL